MGLFDAFKGKQCKSEAEKYNSSIKLGEHKMICPKCGNISNEGVYCTRCSTPLVQSVQAPYQQMPVPAHQQPWYQKWWIWVAAGVLVIGIISFQQLGKRQNDGQVKPSDNTAVSSDSQVKDDTNEIEATAGEYGVGDSVTMDGITVTVNSCEVIRDYKYSGPDKGNVYIGIHVSIENNSKDEDSLGGSNFECYADDIAVEQDFFIGDHYINPFISVAPGKAVEGYLYYEVPENAQIELQFSPDILMKDKRTSFFLDYYRGIK